MTPAEDDRVSVAILRLPPRIHSVARSVQDGHSPSLLVLRSNRISDSGGNDVVEIPRENFPFYLNPEVGKPVQVRDHQSGQRKQKRIEFTKLKS